MSLEFKAKRRRLKVTIDEDVVEVRFPTLGDVADFRVKFAEAADQSQATLDFLAKLGLDADQINRLEVGDVAELMAVLTDQKKS